MSGHDELHDLWCSQPFGKTGRGEDMLDFVEKRTNRFDRAMAVRNWIECSAAGVVAAISGFSAFRVGDALTRAGSLVIAASAAWIIFYLLRYGKGPREVDPTLDLRGYAQALVNRYDHQIRLLKSAKYWYLLPPYLGLLVWMLGILRDKARIEGLSWGDSVPPLVCSAVFAAIWWLNEVYSVGRLRQERANLLVLTADSEVKTE